MRAFVVRALWVLSSAAVIAACGGDDDAPADAATDATDAMVDADAADTGVADTGVADTAVPITCEGRWTSASLTQMGVASGDAIVSTHGSDDLDETVALHRRTLSSRAGLEVRVADVPPARFVLLHVQRELRGALRRVASHWETLGGGFVLARFPAGLDSPLPVRLVGLLEAQDKLGPRTLGAALFDVYRFESGELRREVRRGDALSLARDPDVLGVRRHFAPEPTMDRVRRAVHADEAQRFAVAAGLPLYDGPTGRGACIAVVDTGIYASNPDFWAYDASGASIGRRAIGETVAEGEGAHGTLVAGFIGGNGWISDGYSVGGRTGTPFHFRGIAPGVSELVSVLSGGPAPWNTAFLDYGCHASNHSHTQSDGSYGRRSLDWDRVLFFGAFRGEEVAPPRPVVFSMGNNGAYHSHPDIPVRGYYGGSAPAKNPIVVGGTNTNDDTHAPGAASGPTLDGRMKPDLVAGGYVDVRPFEGTEIALEEVRLVATAGSGASDIVWTPGTAGPWRLGSVIESADIVDGRAVFRAFGSETWVRYEPPAPIDAASYDTVTVSLEILDAGDPALHQPPTRLAIQWDRDGDGRLDRGNWPYVTPVEGPTTYTHTLGGWADTPHSLRVDVARYESSSVVVSHRGGYRTSGGGTSLSAPVVSGAIALLIEQLTEDHGYDFEETTPLPSSFKALMVHTANDLSRFEAPPRDPPNPDTMEALIYHPGPDWSTGYGLLDVGRLVDLVNAHSSFSPRFVERLIADGEMHAYEMRVSGDGGPLRATLAWDDFPASDSLDPRESVLINDLDVVAISPSGIAHSPWIFHQPPLADDPLSGIDPITTADIVPATRCAEGEYWSGASTLACEDHLNNLEQVLVDDPEAGTWQILVRGQVLEDDQRYSLVVTQACASE
jgi:subtilisin family serine protease